MKNNKILILLPVINASISQEKILDILGSIEDPHLCIVDDGVHGEYDIIEDSIKELAIINRENGMGIGATILTGYRYARDYNYEFFVVFDPENTSFVEDYKQIQENLDYGFDLVNCSRILENYNHEDVSEEIIKIATAISASINQDTEYDITDPFSMTFGVKTTTLNDMEFTEYDFGFFIQLWIQSSYFGLTALEIPSYNDTGFGKEFNYFSDPIGDVLTLLETEKYLYKRGKIN